MEATTKRCCQKNYLNKILQSKFKQTFVRGKSNNFKWMKAREKEKRKKLIKEEKTSKQKIKFKKERKKEIERKK